MQTLEGKKTAYSIFYYLTLIICVWITSKIKSILVEAKIKTTLTTSGINSSIPTYIAASHTKQAVCNTMSSFI